MWIAAAKVTVALVVVTAGPFALAIVAALIVGPE